MYTSRQAYLENSVKTATPEQLQLMLYEGAIRFAQQCKAALNRRDYEDAQTAYERYTAVVNELQAGLRPDRDPDLAEKFSILYLFCQRRMDDANFRHDTGLVDEAVGILQHIVQTWKLVINQIAGERQQRVLDVEVEERSTLTLEV